MSHSAKNLYNQVLINLISNCTSIGLNLAQTLAMEKSIANEEVTYPLNYTPLVSSKKRESTHLHTCTALTGMMGKTIHVFRLIVI